MLLFSAVASNLLVLFFFIKPYCISLLTTFLLGLSSTTLFSNIVYTLLVLSLCSFHIPRNLSLVIYRYKYAFAHSFDVHYSYILLIQSSLCRPSCSIRWISCFFLPSSFLLLPSPLVFLYFASIFIFCTQSFANVLSHSFNIPSLY